MRDAQLIVRKEEEGHAVVVSGLVFGCGEEGEGAGGCLTGAPLLLLAPLLIK